MTVKGSRKPMRLYTYDVPSIKSRYVSSASIGPIVCEIYITTSFLLASLISDWIFYQTVVELWTTLWMCRVVVKQNTFRLRILWITFFNW